ncbi:hypothetical protein [Spiroplasma endosymbiont of Cantharis rufa]|uniref:hypothetical protein n=1 Tax=Spiroplasma endosymbiont of Cantharis rufa TaxID=3066279 RepID=UPI0030CB3D07
MKKVINFFSILTLLSSTTVAVVACGNTENSNRFYETNYNKAFQTVFNNQNNTKIKEFSMLPDLEKKLGIPEPEPKIEKQAQLLNLSGNELKLNCAEFICDGDNIFFGNELSLDQYGNVGNDNNIKDRIMTQYALDDLAQWFNIEPNEKRNIFYDYSNLELSLDYSKNIYFFGKYRKEENLILWSKQNSLEIIDKKKDKKINTTFNFFDKEFILNEEIIKNLLLAESVNIETEEIIEDNAEEKEINNILKISFEDVDNTKKMEKINIVKNLFYYYQQDLDFKLNNNETEEKELENTQEKYESINLKSFNIDSIKIDKISIEINIKGEENEENNLYSI